MSKSDFVQACLNNGIEKDKAEEAWKWVSKLQSRIRNNWDLMKYMRNRDSAERLALREAAAERGTEYTPSEVDDLIDVIGIVQDQMEYEEN